MRGAGFIIAYARGGIKNGEGPSVQLWKKIAAQSPDFGHPEKFFKDI